MRCSAYEGCQLQVWRGRDFFFLKAFPVLVPFPVFPISSVRAAGREFPERAGRCPGHQLLFEQHMMCAHDVVPDWGKPLWAARAPSN